MAPPRYRLKLDRLDFISPVDVPAQETAKTLLIKRAGGVAKTFAEVKKLSDELGLVFCWAFTSKVAGDDYHDLQGDAIDPDFMKACAAFMEGARAVDTMHDGVQKGSVTFGMPMTPEIAKAFFGIEVDTVGFMVAIKPAAEDYAKFKSGEYTGVSIAGMGTRETVKRGLKKQCVLTDEQLGHQHSIDLDDPCDEWASERLSTSYQTAEGDTAPHCHAWVYDPATGAIEIAADSGHTHVVTALVPADVLLAAAATEADEPADALEDAATPDEEPAAQPVVIQINARAPRGNSTRPITTSKVDTMKLVVLTEAQHAHYSKLAGADAEAFLLKSSLERDGEVQKARDIDPIIFKGEKTGAEVRKSDGDLALRMAKQAEASALEVGKLNEQVATEKAARELVEVTKRANDTIGALAGTTGAHVDVMRAVESIADTAKRDAALATLKAANAVMVARGTASGVTPGPNEELATPIEASGPEADLRKYVLKFQADNKIATYPQALNKALDGDAEAQRLYNATRN